MTNVDKTICIEFKKTNSPKECVKKAFLENNLIEVFDACNAKSLYVNYITQTVQLNHSVSVNREFYEFYQSVGKMAEFIYTEIKRSERDPEIWSQGYFDDFINDQLVRLSHQYHYNHLYEVYLLKWAALRTLSLYHEIGDDCKTLTTKLMDCDFMDEKDLSFPDFSQSDFLSLPIYGITGEWPYRVYEMKCELDECYMDSFDPDMPAEFEENPMVCALINLLGRVAAFRLDFKMDHFDKEKAEEMLNKFSFKGLVEIMMMTNPEVAKYFWKDGFMMAATLLNDEEEVFLEPFDMSEADNYMEYIG